MFKIPNFRIYGDGDPTIEDSIQPHLALRTWSALKREEKELALQHLDNNNWIPAYSDEILSTISYLNNTFLRRCPGRTLHKIPPQRLSRGRVDENEQMRAALLDFQHLFLIEASDALVFKMLSVFAQRHINRYDYSAAQKEPDETKRREYVEKAFEKFDRLSNCLNHIFEQFAVNVVLTRNGLVPRQDVILTEEIYVPTLRALADPQWKTVSDDLAAMFATYRAEVYDESITRAHRAVQRFLQILVGEEGKSGKGEVGKLFSMAKKENLIPVNRFTEPLIQVIQSFISSERATKSTAKPAKDVATSTDALLVMNIVIVFLQYCLHNTR